MTEVLTEVAPPAFNEEIVDGYKRITGEFWTARQRQMHSIHYAVSYRASFKPELPNFFIERHCSDREKDIVCDPFGGRGTTILEANILGYAGISNDVNPLSERIARPKTRPVTITDLKSVLNDINLDVEVDMSDYDRFIPFYHPDTYRELVALKQYLRENRSDVDCFIEMIALSRLHGHSTGFFSVYSFPQISIPSSAQARINVERDQKPDYRPIKPRIARKAKRVLTDFTDDELAGLHEVSSKNQFTCEDTREMKSIKDESVALIVTSPPFLNKADYITDNWLEFWFLDINEKPLRDSIVQTDDLKVWRNFIAGSLVEMHRILRPGGVAVIEVGDVTYKGQTVNLDEVVVGLGRDAGLSVREVLINSQQFTKLANCFKVDNMKKGTNTNRLVVFEKK